MKYSDEIADIAWYLLQMQAAARTSVPRALHASRASNASNPSNSAADAQAGAYQAESSAACSPRYIFVRVKAEEPLDALTPPARQRRIVPRSPANPCKVQDNIVPASGRRRCARSEETQALDPGDRKYTSGSAPMPNWMPSLSPWR